MAFNKVQRYVILDDITDFFPYQKPFHVQTDEMIGLKDEHIERLKQLFATELSTVQS
jgi:hypothetical protein